jgi:argininosuccinate lyase
MWQVDGLVQLVSTLASLALTESSLAEDLEIWASAEFDYVDLAEAHTRSSVLMPQKRNPYSLSIIRGHAGLMVGQVAGLLAVQKSPSARSDNLIFAYGEVPTAVERARRVTELTAAVVEGLSVNETRLAGALAAGFSQSTDVAEQVMVSCGLDYRSAYEVVGDAVRRLSEAGRSARDLTAALLDEVAVARGGQPLGMDPVVLADALDPNAIVRTRSALGGTAAEPMAAMLAAVRNEATALAKAASRCLAAFDAAEDALVAEAGRVAAEDG